MKALVNSYACSPYQGSEPGMGWNFVSHLAHRHELHIITECKFRDDIERYLSLHPEEKPYYHFYYVKRVRWNLLRKIWPPSYYWTYASWQRKALTLAKELDRQENFDLIHQLNMVGFREPGYLWKMDKPFVWGPMGNFNITPWKILPIMGWYGACYYAGRNMINWWQARFLTRVRKAAKRADAIICATEDDKKAVKRFFDKDSVVIPEVGLIDIADASGSYAKRVDGERLRVCWSGIHVPRKALPLLLKAVSQCAHKQDIELHILGKGQCTEKWKRMTKDLGITNVSWYGQVSREVAIDVMSKSHVFTMTSLSEATSTVLLEALSLHIPVVVLNHLGFAGVVNGRCGIKIDLHNLTQIVHDMAAALDKLYEDETYRQTLAEGAYRRALDFSWTEKADEVDNIYNTITLNTYQK